MQFARARESAFGLPKPLAEATRKHRSAVLLIALFTTFVNVLGLTGSLFMLQVYDRVLPSRSEPTLVVLFLLVVLLYGSMALLDLVRGQVGARVGAAVQTEATIAANLADIAKLDVEAARLAAARQEKAVTELREVETKLVELEEQKRLIETRIARLELRAPRDGIVQGLTIHTIGAVIRPADPVLSVVPQDRLFTITARIEADKVDSVFPGQAAVLHFASFDARTTPELKAIITRVSADIVTDNRTGVQFYTADAVPDSGEIAKLDGKDLLPGMPVEVFIQTGSHSPLAYILKPFTDYFAKAMKE